MLRHRSLGVPHNRVSTISAKANFTNKLPHKVLAPKYATPKIISSSFASSKWEDIIKMLDEKEDSSDIPYKFRTAKAREFTQETFNHWINREPTKFAATVAGNVSDMAEQARQIEDEEIVQNEDIGFTPFTKSEESAMNERNELSGGIVLPEVNLSLIFNFQRN